MNRKNSIALVFSLVLLLTAVVTAVAQIKEGEQPRTRSVSTPNNIIPLQLTYQGRLTNSSGSPINSTVNVVFKLYDVNGNLTWTSATRSITPINGLFTVYLGGNPDPAIWHIEYADSIGITVGSDPEMTPRQPFNSIYGHGINADGVVGSSTTGDGVLGKSESGYAGVRGEGQATNGVYGTTSDPNYSGVVANNSTIPGIALTIENGALKVTGASSGSSTPVFMHHVYTSTTMFHNSTLCSGSNFASVINNIYTNDNSNAILLVTPNYRQANPPIANGAGPAKDVPAVFYSVNDRCGAANNNRWVIYNLNATPMVDDTFYNVMVIVP